MSENKENVMRKTFNFFPKVENDKKFEIDDLEGSGKASFFNFPMG